MKRILGTTIKVLSGLLTIGVVKNKFSNTHEYSIPSLIREDLFRGGIDPDILYNLSNQEFDRLLLSKNFDPIEINHYMYGPLHKKYRRN